MNGKESFSAIWWALFAVSLFWAAAALLGASVVLAIQVGAGTGALVLLLLLVPALPLLTAWLFYAQFLLLLRRLDPSLLDRAGAQYTRRIALMLVSCAMLELVAIVFILTSLVFRTWFYRGW